MDTKLVTNRRIAWNRLIQASELPKDGSSNCFMPYTYVDQGCYSAIRLLSCSNCITHTWGDDTIAHVKLDLRRKESWQEIKRDYGLVDYVISSNAPINEADYILTYGYAIARKGVFIGGAGFNDWFNKSTIVDKLQAPRMYLFACSEPFYFWSK